MLNREPIEILYRIDCGGDKQFDIPIRFDASRVERIQDVPHEAPPWALLENHRCACCTLPVVPSAACPAAMALVDLVQYFGDMLSYTEARVVVVTKQREVHTQTSMQRVLSSLVGLFMATSGCPSMAFLKPMARFHLPFASRQETLYRAVTSHMLFQYFQHRDNRPCDMTMERLQESYQRLSIVNRRIADRLREATEGDANVNAVVLLDLFALDIPMAIEDGLADLADIFQAAAEPAE